MIGFKTDYFHDGCESGHKEDISVHLKRPSNKEMDKWTDEEKNGLKDYIKNCQEKFTAFINELNQFIPE